MENLNLKKEAQTRHQEESRKKEYHSPEFVEYGKVAKLTQAAAGSFADVTGMMMDSPG
jgi:hypothetical protein